MRILKEPGKRNRAYVVMNDGTKIFYGTINRCYKFMEYMKEGVKNGVCKMDKRG